MLTLFKLSLTLVSISFHTHRHSSTNLQKGKPSIKEWYEEGGFRVVDYIDATYVFSPDTNVTFSVNIKSQHSNQYTFNQVKKSWLNNDPMYINFTEGQIDYEKDSEHFLSYNTEDQGLQFFSKDKKTVNRMSYMFYPYY